MAKRVAATTLNNDNWDAEDEPEEVGDFKRASEDELKKRVIKTATRRRNPNSDTENRKNIFSGFSGFSSVGMETTKKAEEIKSNQFSFLSKIPTETKESTSNDNKSMFSFGSNSGNKTETDKNGSTTSPKSSFLFGTNTSSENNKESTTKPMFSFGTNFSNTNKTNENANKNFSFGGNSDKKIETDTITISDDEKSNTNSLKDSEKKTTDTTNEYHKNLKDLNISVMKWITEHVTKNPLCILTPIFKDYENHLESIKKEDNKISKPSLLSTSKSSTNQFSGFTFTSVKPEQSTTTTLTFNKPLSPLASSTETSEKKNEIKFGGFGNTTTTSSTISSAGSFSFNPNQGFSAKPFTFAANVSAPPSDKKDDEDAEEEPPKNEFTPVEEKDSVYSKRCKVFIKKDGKYSDRGVGTLHIKPVKDSNKTQLLVRADTNLGNIIINTLLSSSIPVQKMKKNNVLLICVPTPDHEPPPTTVLLRVQTENDADDLLEQIKKFIPKDVENDN